MRQLVKTPRAKQDLRELSSYIARDSLDAALRFLDAAEKAFDFLLDEPESGITYQTLNQANTGPPRPAWKLLEFCMAPEIWTRLHSRNIDLH